MERDTGTDGLGEAQAAQPRLGLFGVGPGEDVAQHARGRRASDRGDGQNVEVAAVELRTGQALQQRARQIGVLVELGELGRHARGGRRLGAEREGERGAVGPTHERADGVRVRQAVLPDERGGLVVAKRAEVHDGRHMLPAVREPPGLWAATAGDDDERALREVGQDAAAQVAAGGGHPLVGVEDDKRAGVRRDALQGGLELAGDRRQVTAFDEDGGIAATDRAPRHLAQEGRLADPAGAVDVDDRGRCLVGQEGVEDGEFAVTAHEGPLVAPCHAVSEGAGHRPATVRGARPSVR
jgi:hypothetical protein